MFYLLDSYIQCSAEHPTEIDVLVVVVATHIWCFIFQLDLDRAVDGTIKKEKGLHHIQWRGRNCHRANCACGIWNCVCVFTRRVTAFPSIAIVLYLLVWLKSTCKILEKRTTKRRWMHKTSRCRTKPSICHFQWMFLLLYLWTWQMIDLMTCIVWSERPMATWMRRMLSRLLFVWSWWWSVYETLCPLWHSGVLAFLCN